MKMSVLKFLVIPALALGTSGAFAATKLSSEKDKVSYMIGYQIGSNFKRDGLEVDLKMVLNGMKEASTGVASPLTAEESQKLMTDLQKNLQVKAETKQKTDGEKNSKEGKAFLEENAKKKDITKLPSGLQYKELTAGKGDSPKATDTVKTHYRGTLINGTEFDSSYKRGQPATFPVTGVIKGWTEALQLMKPGAKWQLFVPADLAYGEGGAGESIGPNSTLIFEVELLSIEKKEEPKTAEKKEEPKPAVKK